MPGVKGRSGRKPLGVDVRRRKIIDKAWELLMEYFESPDVPLEKKVEHASKVCVRSIPVLDDDGAPRALVIQLNHNYDKDSRKIMNVDSVEEIAQEIRNEQHLIEVQAEEMIQPKPMPNVNINHVD